MVFQSATLEQGVASYVALRGEEVTMVTVALLELAEREFPFLMRHPTNREDALQVLAIAHWEAGGRETPQAVRAALWDLAHDLGFHRPDPTGRRAA